MTPIVPGPIMSLVDIERDLNPIHLILILSDSNSCRSILNLKKGSSYRSLLLSFFWWKTQCLFS